MHFHTFKALIVNFFQRFSQKPLVDPEALADFVSTRSAYIAQSSLYGYLKTRMGTQFPKLFEDKQFSKVLKTSAEAVYLDCLADLSCYAAATLHPSLLHEGEKTKRFALTCFAHGLPSASKDLPTIDNQQALDHFQERIHSAKWDELINPELAFSTSITNLIKHAPVIDAFKTQDKEIVSNSIKFHWRDVREQLNNRLNTAECVANLDPWLQASRAL